MTEVEEHLNLPGIRIYDLKPFFDERGFLTEIIRTDWKEIVGEDEVVQANLSYNYPGIIRAWHRHLRGQVDYFFVLRGAMKICAYDDRNNLTHDNLVEIVSSASKLQLVRIPGIYWHGIKAVSNDPALVIYFTNRLYDYENPDEERRPWNDPAVIDPKTGKPFDWNKLPFK